LALAALALVVFGAYYSYPSGLGRAGKLRLMGKYIGHRFVAQPEPDTFRIASTIRKDCPKIQKDPCLDNLSAHFMDRVEKDCGARRIILQGSIFVSGNFVTTFL